jgi:type VI secretion system protein ImpK
MADKYFQAPSLFGAIGPGTSPRGGPAAAPTTGVLREASSLLDLLYDGFYMIFMLRNRAAPIDADAFRARIRDFLAGFEREARRLQAEREDIHLAKFAFCALVDEVVLMSQSKVRDAWERLPLQLELFGEQLAGERFFEHLERLREGGASKVQLLEVFHMCQLMGFQGKYVVEGSEKLGYLTGRVGDEIAQHKGKRLGFAPHWAAPDRVVHALRSETPAWAMASIFALLGLLGFVGVRHVLAGQTAADLAGYADVVKLAPQPAYVILTLP